MFRAVACVALVVLGTVAACSADPAAAGPDVPNPDGKSAGAGCKVAKDCASLKCEAGKCGAVAGANPTNTKKDGDETDVDCGGKSAPKCADGKACTEAEDCESAACTGAKCKSPAPDDTLKNGDETDVDCGGAKAPKCATGKACAANSDCASDGCSYDKTCVEYRSCVAHFGGDTCGVGETGTPGAKHESCCNVVQSQGIKVGKFQVTSGRIRAFIDRYKGDLQGWAKTNPKNWKAEWNDQLPASADDAIEVMGPANKRGCRITQSGGGSRTYWTPTKEYADGRSDTQEYKQDVLDEKAQNCVPWHMAQALCAFDGGRLMSLAELKKLRTNGGTTKWPWGDTPAFVFKSSANPIVHTYNYQVPEKDGQDQSRFVAPPGRFPDGANKDGVQDMLGNLLPWMNDSPRLFAWTASWEDSHPVVGTGGQTKETQTWPGANSPGGEEDGYWGIGFRCVFE